MMMTLGLGMRNKLRSVGQGLRNAPTASRNGRFVLFLAVIPWYRQECVDLLKDRLGADLSIYGSAYGLDGTVRTGIHSESYRRVRRFGVLRDRVLVQSIPIEAIRADACIVDLNPRSISAWVVLLARRIVGKRVLVWGHLHPREGKDSKTAKVRRAMRKIAHGSVLYGYDSVPDALAEVPKQPVWVAANAIYRAGNMTVTRNALNGRSFVYVGRLEAAKEVAQLVPAFYESELWKQGITLDIIGSGSERGRIEDQVEELGMASHVKLHGQINSHEELRTLYSKAICSLSPGYVGLSATQSLGFGVPMIYAEIAPHAPEIELRRLGHMRGYSPSSTAALGTAMRTAYSEFGGPDVDHEEIARSTRRFYSAEIMADGIISSLTDVPIHYSAGGWPEGATK